MNSVLGGVCVPKGFLAAAVHCGIRKNRTKKDLSLIYSTARASVASVYTRNVVKGAPLVVTKNNIKDGFAKAIICNSGNANTCNANGIEIAEKMCELVADELNICKEDVVVASTGVIGEPLDIEPIEKGIKPLVSGLGNNSRLAAEGIMTTDTLVKEAAYTFDVDGVQCSIGGIAKGSGMIHPNMATMLVFITTDIAISNKMLQKALSEDVETSFNMVSVDGDTSTNDMVTVLANGLAGNKCIDEEGENFEIFKKALNTLTTYLCKLIAKDGEGATKLLISKVINAKTELAAKTSAKAVVCSSLVKAAFFGADANWGRILCAVGYSGADLDIDKIDVTFVSKKGEVNVCKSGHGVGFSEEIAKEVLSDDEIEILINLNDGQASATAWGCDLTYDYVKINGDYRT